MVQLLLSLQYCPDSSSGFVYDSNSNYCFLAVESYYTWLSAEYYCQQFTGGHLAGANNSVTSGVLSSNFASQTSRSWIGYSRLFYSGTTSSPLNQFKWIDSSGTGYSSWASNEPRSSLSENCAFLYGSAHTWNDYGCWLTQRSVCKKSS
eukprot:gene10848-14561_t